MERDFRSTGPPGGATPRTRQAASGEEPARLAAARERAQVAHELHDGVLQFLSGMALRVQLILRVADDVGKVRERLAGVQDELLQAQRALRQYVERLQSPRASAGEEEEAEQDLALLGTLLARQWKVQVRTRAAYGQAPGPDLEHELFGLVSEAVAAGVRHGGARSISVDVRGNEDELRLDVEGDGRGFGPVGATDSAASAGPHPCDLRARVQALAGRLVSHCPKDAGARLQIVLPLVRGEQARR